jgi:hypothetical protein
MKTLSMSKFHASLCAAVLAVASLSSTSHAQRTDTIAKVNVPFEFEFGSKHFAAGVYTMHMESNHIVTIHSASKSGLAMTMWDINLKPSTQSKMIFRNYGGRLFLHEVWMAGDIVHLQCIETKAEKQAERTQLASNAVPVPDVELALLETPR